MKKLHLLSALIFTTFQFASAQILCVQCFNQNDSIGMNVINHIVNGSFENTTCLSNQYTSSFCPNSSYYSCSVANWTCTGGGTASYASIDDNTFTVTPQGPKAAYFGNGSSAYACSGTFNDTSCLATTSCEITTIPTGYPTNDATYGGITGVSMSQTVTGLTVGTAYVLEFWAGGEPQTNGWMLPGVFAVDIGFGNTFLRCKPTQANPVHIGTRFIIQFKATSTSHTIKFTNWGHICIPCTELILDHVRLYTTAELPPFVSVCSTDAVSELEENQITVFPNPATNQLTVSSNSSLVSEITLFDITTRQLLHQTFTGSVILNTESFAKGIYFYEIKNKSGVIHTGRLEKQ